MCGIAGFLRASADTPENVLRSTARAMGEAIRHRGPDGSGVWADAEAGISLAHRRLAVLDLTEAGHQPMASETGRFLITFNGEIYNHLNLRREMANDSFAPNWRGHSDTETLLAAIERWGIETTLRRATGMFAFAVWDRAERTLTLARDRMGEKPLYYGRVGKSLVFGSELRALRAHPEFDCAIDRNAVALLLQYNAIPAPHSIFAGISKLPPATYLQIGDGASAIPQSYWSFRDLAEQATANPFHGSTDAAADRLETLLGDVLEGQMLSDVPLGAFLSGGVDSSAIAALMQSRSSRPVRTFSIGFSEAAFNEAEHAAAVAAHLGTDHTELVVTQADALETAQDLPSLYDEPFADASQIPTAILSRLTRQYVTVALSGDGADELFGGYNRYVWAPKLWRSIGGIPRPLRHLIGHALLGISSPDFGRLIEPASVRLGLPVTLSRKLSKLGATVGSARTFDEVYIGIVSEWMDTDAVVIDGGAPKTMASSPEQWPKLREGASRLMAADTLTYLPDDILIKVDRAAMAASLETRAPYLDPRVVEFAWRLPLSEKISGGETKRVLRRLLYRHVPKSLIERPKQGFAVPLDDWLRSGLRDWAEDLLSPEKLRASNLFDVEQVRSVWRQHLTRRRQCGNRLWSILMVQAWVEQG
ncbi:asparagine synthase (glutamine-hydrolyzing) [Jiella sp. M17.18]|uniref:asparagine synthase (glutamine-hydrolyzing) n=1 Tax=Jiella sp. M17.18 TaxID=3234247 RepID=UPI0034DF4355